MSDERVELVGGVFIVVAATRQAHTDAEWDTAEKEDFQLSSVTSSTHRIP